jgi:hypothetical protein
MRIINVAASYQVVIRYATDVPDTELEALIEALNKQHAPQRLRDAVFRLIHGFPGVAIEIYEDDCTAPTTSAATTPLRRTGT